MDAYRARLERGQDYALGAWHHDDGDAFWTLKGPTGTVLWEGVTGQGGDDGTEFRAGRDGHFTVEAKDAGAGETYPRDYTFRLIGDCRKDARTRCTIRAGQSQGHTLTYGGDQDWVELAGLNEGRRYCAVLTVTTCPADLALVTSAGAVKVDAGTATSGDRQSSACFKAPSGTWYIRVRGDADVGGSSYALELRQG